MPSGREALRFPLPQPARIQRKLNKSRARNRLLVEQEYFRVGMARAPADEQHYTSGLCEQSRGDVEFFLRKPERISVADFVIPDDRVGDRGKVRGAKIPNGSAAAHLCARRKRLAVQNSLLISYRLIDNALQFLDYGQVNSGRGGTARKAVEPRR